jgi:1A family penicillin-binding protein
MANRKQPRSRRSVRKWIPKARWKRALLAVSGLCVVAAIALFWRLYRKVDDFLAGQLPGPIRIYADSTVLRPGINVEGAHLLLRLRRLGYAEVSGFPRQPGSFRAGRDRIDIALRRFADPDGEHAEQIVRLDLSRSVVETIRNANGGEIGQAAIEPELLGTYTGGVLGERRVLALGDFPRHVVSAVLAAEDARFATHPGIDPLGLLRAVWVNFRGGGVRQGGSTITQQLAKNLFLSPERTIARKANETVLALILEARMTKQQILEAYLNNVYLGQSESIGIFGVGQGARAFFGKEVRELTVAEAATIAGLIHSPNLDSPLRHPDRARNRRDQVLDLMAQNAWLTPEELERARLEPLRLQKRFNQPLEAPFFIDEVLRRIARLGYDTDVVRGLSVYTTLDLEVQHLAEHALSSGLDNLERTYPRLTRATSEPLEGAIVVVETGTAYVRGLAGGRDFARSQFNRVTRSKRQPGSAFKPFVYLAALDDPDDIVTPATILRDEPIQVRVGTDQWSPENYDGRYVGDVTVRGAIEDSRNVPTVELAQRIGLGRVAELARSAGLGEIPELPAVALGSIEVSLIDLVGAYTIFPNLGSVVRPALIRGVVSGDGEVLYRDRLRAKRVATAAAAYVTSHLLEGVVEEGTGAAVRRLGITQAVAGKTGTTNEAKDAWFIGYSPDLIGGVWVGFDDGTPIGLTGAKAALPVWVAFMRDALRAYESRPFEIPQGVVFRDVDRHSGMLASWSCPESVHEAFIIGTEPMVTCDGQRLEAQSKPREKVLNWFERLFHGR